MTEFVSELEFDLNRWCIRNGFKDLFSKLEEMGISTEEDLTMVTEDDLNELGVTKPFIRKKFFLKANESYKAYLTASEHFENREIETKKFQHDLILLAQLKKNNAISDSEYNQMRTDRAAKYHKFFGGDDGEVEQKTKEPSIKIYPQRDDVFLDVSFTNQAGREAYMGSASSSSVNLDGKEDGVYNCVSFIVPGGRVTESDLHNGAFSSCPSAPMRGSRLGDIEVLKVFEVTKTGNTFAPSFVDTGASAISVKFVHEDSPVGEAAVKGKFTSDNTGKSYELNNRTDGGGRLNVALPPGKMQCAVTTPSGKAVEASHSVPKREEVRDVADIPVATELNIISNSRICTYMPQSWSKDRPVLLLGDVSGSMSSGERMSHLRETFLHLFHETTEMGGKIALAVWNTGTVFARPTYLGSSDAAFVKGWLDGTTAGGGNEMRQAMQQGKDKFPDVKDMFVMCDGDISPFDISSWTSFTRPFVEKGIRIHTVAFAEDSDHAKMQEMARLCGGMFTSANKNK